MDLNRVNTLKEYFETGYDEGMIFENKEYSFLENVWCWKHNRTGILVWADPLDLRDEDEIEEGNCNVYYHYTSLLAFQNITNDAKEKVELWASLVTQGEGANAYWGKGVYTVPKPPDQWESLEQILDNNYRSMMKRDRKDKGDEYVEKEYPPRVQCCIPIVVHPDKAYDVSLRQTPEMRRAQKPPGENLAGILLNPPGLPPRTCVVVRNRREVRRLSVPRSVWMPNGDLSDRKKSERKKSELAPGELHVKGDLLAKALRRLQVVKERHGSENDETMRAQLRVAMIYSQQGHQENRKAKNLLRKVVRYRLKKFGPQDLDTLRQCSRLSAVLMNLGQFKQAMDLQIRVLRSLPRDATADGFAEERHRSLSQIGAMHKMQQRMKAAEPFLIEAYLGRKGALGNDHFDTLCSLQDVASVSVHLKKHQQAIDSYTEALDGLSKQLGKNHPASLSCEVLLAETYALQRDYQASLNMYASLCTRISEQLGATHPKSMAASAAYAVVLCESKQAQKALTIWWQRVCLSGPMNEFSLLCQILLHSAKARGLFGFAFAFIASFLFYVPALSIALKFGGQLRIPWPVAFTPLWLLQVAHFVLAAFAFKFRQRSEAVLRHQSSGASPQAAVLRRPESSSQADRSYELGSDAIHFDMYILQINTALLGCSVFMVIRLVGNNLPWPSVVGPWLLLELYWSAVSTHRFWLEPGGRKVLKFAWQTLFWFLRVLMVLWTPCRVEEWSVATKGPWYIVACPAYIMVLLSFLETMLPLIESGSFSPLACAVFVANSRDSKRNVGKTLLALTSSSLLTGIGYKREVDKDASIILMTLPLMVLALMPAMILVFLGGLVIFRRVKTLFKRMRQEKLADDFSSFGL